MLRALINRLQSVILARPGLVLALSGALAALSLVLATSVEFRTSRSELAPPDDPDQQRLNALLQEFRGSGSLIACVEAAPGATADPLQLRRFTDELAAAFRAEPAVSQVFHKVDLQWLLRYGLYLLPAADVERAVEAAVDDGIPALVGELKSFEDLNRAIASRIESGLQRVASAPEPEEVEGVRRLAGLLEGQRRFLEAPNDFVAELEKQTPLMFLMAESTGRVVDGYLKTADGDVLFVMISPADAGDDLATLRRFVGAMGRHADELLSRSPGFQVAFTGEPAMVVEEMDSVRRDTLFTSVVAVIGVTLLTLLVFRWKSHSLLVLGALAAGVLWAFGALRWPVVGLGYLNLITSSFISTLVGVGVAYGIHPVSEYELEGAHTRNPVDATRMAYHHTGPAVTVAAVTTSAAFFSILLMQFRGFAELGLVAGVGVLLCLLAAMVTLPAMLVLYGRRRARRDRAPRDGAVSAPVDRVWVERIAGRVCRFPKTTTLLALVLTVLAGWAARGIGFNTNLLDLLPDNAESARYQRRMIEDSDLSPVFNMVVAEDLQALKALRDRALREIQSDDPDAEATVERFESILHFLPEDHVASRRAVDALGRLLDMIEPPAQAGPITRAGVIATLDRLVELLEAAAEDAFTAGVSEMIEPLELATAEADAARRAAEQAPEGIEREWQRGQVALLGWFHRLVDELREAAEAEAPSVAALPEEIRDRFLTDTGRYIGLLYPAGSVFEPGRLEPYVEASLRISEEATGFPLVFHRMSHRITLGFRRAVIAGAVIVLLILLVTYRNLRDAGLAVVPLAMGIVWMLGGMRLLERVGGALGLSGIELAGDFNFANLVAVPLIIGVGIDNGVHVISRLRFEGREGMSVVLRHTGRAILIASLTTMIGFGSLSLASHRGLACLGTVLLLGVGSCLLTSTVVLPNLLIVLGIVKR